MTVHHELAARQSLNQSAERTNGDLGGRIFDVAIIGAGVVGCAIARRFTLEGASVAVVEKASDILDGASKANSAILHTGFDAPPDSVELSCIRNGYREYLDIHQEMALPLENCAAHVVAWSDGEIGALEAIVEKAHANGIDDVRLIDGEECRRAEPQLSQRALAAVVVPGESIIDPWSAPYAYLRQSLLNGGKVFLSSRLESGCFDGEQWRLDISDGVLQARHVINCAGLYGDLLEQAVFGTADFQIKPRKGQFVVYDKAASQLLNSIILPVPTNRTKGVVVCRTIFGNVLVGPTAEDQDSRSDASTEEEALRMLIASAADKVPALAQMPITAVYAGLRPATQFKDYQIASRPGRNWITVGGIRSTGLSSALGIARHVYQLYCASGVVHQPVNDPNMACAPALAERSKRSWQSDDHGEIICHCELVTKNEIEQALTGPLKAQSLAGLKRQTRVTMGRCQGFYCMARLAELTKGHFITPLSHDLNAQHGGGRSHD